jgi:NAD-dependent dihydropyrimidine dehydrogenase PreA subunit
MIELPLLDETRCSGCADCVAVCPTDCLAMQGAMPYLIRPADCISCGLCVLVCPSAALDLAEPA